MNPAHITLDYTNTVRKIEYKCHNFIIYTLWLMKWELLLLTLPQDNIEILNTLLFNLLKHDYKLYIVSYPLSEFYKFV